MSNSIISEGRTTSEAIENGLKQLKVTKEEVEIKVLDNENKKSFFSILTPRIVKVELTLKENAIQKKEERPKKEYEHNLENLEKSKKRLENFLKEWLQKIDKDLNYSIKIEDYTIYIDIKGNSAGVLIGYRGDTLNAMQTIISSIVNHDLSERVRVILDIENYRQKREKILIDLAQKVSKTVLKKGKSITLEPMSAYERKIIHSALQENTKIETYSIGEGDNRRVVISKINK